MKIFLASILTLFLTTVSAATSPITAFNLIKEGKAVMVDVREKEEIEQGMIERAVWFPKSKITSDDKWLEEFTELTDDKEIFLYCRSGRRSEEVRKILKSNGIESVNLGGYNDLQHILPTVIPTL